MIRCKSCKSAKMACVTGKCSDMCEMSVQGCDVEHEGYVPKNMGIGGGDYLEFSYCLDCGQIRGEFPVKVTFDAE